MVESPQRIWIEADDECPYFYEAHELHDVEQDVIEYVRADLYAALEAKLAEAREALAESDRHAEKLEAMLDPHIAWEGKPAKAYAELTEALQKAEAENVTLRMHLEALSRTGAEQAVTEAMVERAFRDGIKYATICKVSDIDEAWRTSAVRAALKAAMEARDDADR